MKTAVVISDSHGNMRGLSALDGIFKESDYIIHLGDTSTDGAKLKGEYGDKTVLINGNCDPVKYGEDELTFEIEGVKIFATHGHLYSVKTTLDKLYMRGNEENCRIALFGHTHRAEACERDNLTILNPGNMSRYSKNSYLYLVFNSGKFTYKIVEI